MKHYDKMRLRALLTLFCSLCMVATVSAQEGDAYLETLRALYDASPLTSSLRAKTILAEDQARKVLAKEERKGGIALKYTLDAYMEEAYIRDFLSFGLRPLLEPVVAAEELRQLADSLRSPQGQSFVEHMDTIFSGNYTLQYFSAISRFIMFRELWTANPGLAPAPTPVQPMAGIKKAYRKRFAQFYATADLAYAFQGQFMVSYAAVLREVMLKEQGVYYNHHLASMGTYMEKSYQAMALNACHPILTEGDMAFAMSLASLPAYVRLVEGLSALDASSSALAQEACAHYDKWLREKGLVE
ncbi:MAG: hypothetical protein IJ064_00290 [Bacteroidaceae bacterium]|nr:hypothetical protein [Bacteroidaceae bacterium]